MQLSKITRRGAIALSVAAALALAGCGDKGGEAAKPAAEAAKAELIPVGIGQLVEHNALDAAVRGIVDALAERGFKDGVNIKLDIQNAQADQSNLHNIANRFVSNKDRIIFAVATPAAQAVATVAKDTPIIATAITDFVAGKLVKSDEAPLPTDNVIASAVPALAKVVNPAGIPAIAGEMGMVSAGCLGSISVDYYELGKMTGQMGADVLEGKKKPATTPVEHVQTGIPVFNLKTAKAIGLEIPEELRKGAKLFE